VISPRGLVLAGVTAALLVSTSVPSVFAAGQHFRGHGYLVTKGGQKSRLHGSGAAAGTGRGVFAVRDNSGDTEVAKTGSGAHFQVGQWDVYCGTGSASATSTDADVRALGGGTVTGQGSGAATVEGSYTATTQNSRSSSQMSSHQMAHSAKQMSQFHKAHPATNRCNR
jgi:hypothetical protein